MERSVQIDSDEAKDLMHKAAFIESYRQLVQKIEIAKYRIEAGYLMVLISLKTTTPAKYFYFDVDSEPMMQDFINDVSNGLVKL